MCLNLCLDVRIKGKQRRYGPWSTEKDKHIQRAIVIKCHDDDDGGGDDDDSSSHSLTDYHVLDTAALNRQAFL